MSSNTSSRNNTPISDDEIDLGELFRTLWFHKFPIILTTALFCIGGVIYAFWTTPVYQADAMLEVSNNKNQVLGDLSDILSSTQQTPADTEIELIKSRLVLGQTVQDLGLNVTITPKISFIDKLLSTKKQLPTVDVTDFKILDKTLESKTFTFIAQGKQEYTLITPEGHQYSGHIGKTLTVKDNFSLTVKNIDANFGQSFNLIHYSDLQAIEKIRQNLSVTSKGKNLPIIGLTMTGTNSILIEKTLNSIINNYVTQNRNKDIQTAQNGLEFINEELPRLYGELQDAENKLNEYRSQNKSLDLPNEARGTLESLNKIEMQIVDLKTEESVLSEVYTKDHPAYKALREKIQVLEDAKKRLNQHISNLPSTQQEIIRLTRDVEINQTIYMQLLNKRQELSILRASSQGNVRIIDLAISAEKPIKPKKAIIILVATALGLFLSTALYLLKALMKQGISSEDEIEVLGVDVIGNIPRSSIQDKHDHVFRKLNKKDIARSNMLITIKEPTDPSVEALRALRTNLYFTSMDADNKIIMISGATPAVGKSFISANLTVLMAQSGKKVLLIDADMRKGYIQSLFDIDNVSGLSDMLAETHNNYNQFLQKTNIANLHIMSRGMGRGNPAELLLNNRLPEFLAWAEKYYDHIIMDTPPILAVTDAAIIGQYAGISLLVCQFGTTDITDLNDSINRFKNSNINIQGIVLNGVERTAKNAYKYDYNYSYATSVAPQQKSHTSSKRKNRRK